MKIGIIGGGYTGLTIAKELKNDNNEIVIIEKNSRVGGMVDTFKVDDENLEKYYRHIFKSDKYVIDLIKELDLEDKLIWPATKMGYYINNKMYEFGTPISLLKFRPLSFIEKIRFGLNVIEIKLIKDYKKYEHIKAEDFFVKKVGKNIYQRVWEPLLISKFEREKANIAFTWIWGKINLRQSSKSIDGERLGYIKGSYQLLTDKIEKFIYNKGVKIRKNHEVVSAQKINEKWNLISKNENGEVDEETFDLLISTLAYPINLKLFKDCLTDEEKKKMNLIDYTSAKIMVLFLKKSFMPYYWLNIGDNNIPFAGIIEHTNLIEKNNYNNKNIIYISNYLNENNRLYSLNDKKLLKEYIPYLKMINKNFNENDIIDYKVFEDRYAQPIIKTNYSKNILDVKLAEEGLYIASMPQIYPEDRGMNYAIRLGKDVANLIKGKH